MPYSPSNIERSNTIQRIVGKKKIIIITGTRNIVKNSEGNKKYRFSKKIISSNTI